MREEVAKMQEFLLLRKVSAVACSEVLMIFLKIGNQK